MYQKPSLNAFQLKLIAAALMTVDHCGVLLWPDCEILRHIGRLSFPIFAFIMAESCRHTHSPWRLLLRLGLFALAFQPLYALCMDTRRFNILATLLLGALAVFLWQWLRRRLDGWPGQLAGGAAALLMALLAQWVNAEYGAYGVGLVFTAWACRQEPAQLLICWTALTGLAFLPGAVMGGDQILALLTIPLLLCYNGQRGRGWRWFFYAFYCLHIPLLYIIGQLIS